MKTKISIITISIKLLLVLSLLSINSFAQKQTISHKTSDTITIKGIVEKGIETGCLILKTKDQKIYNLLNIKAILKEGTCLKVTGYIQKNAASICMQGIPFYAVNYCPCSKKSKPKYQRELPKDKVNKQQN